MRKKPNPIRVSSPQLARFRVELVSRDPLVVRCPTCGAEWRPRRVPQFGAQNAEWRCQNNCHQPKQ